MLKLIFLTIILYIIIQHFMEEPYEEVLPIKQEFVKPTKDIKGYEENNNINETSQNRIGVTSVNNQPKILSEAVELIHIGSYSDNSTLNNNYQESYPQANLQAQPQANLQAQPQANPQAQPQANLQAQPQANPQVQPQNYQESYPQASPMSKQNESKIMDFDKPNPWTKIIINPLEEFPYLFHIKAKVPSLNDFENWKQIIPNINFNPKTGELIIPSKDEPSALALSNLILINFSGQLSLQNILEKNLIQISVAKAKSHEMVQNKLREQIMENIYGKQFNSVDTYYEQDLAKKNTINDFKPQKLNNIDRVDFKSDNFVDTFEHFSTSSVSNDIANDIDGWDGGDFSYL
jgi:hypothetical protein